MNQHVTHRFSDTLFSKERVVSPRTRWESDETFKWLIANRYSNTTQSVSYVERIKCVWTGFCNATNKLSNEKTHKRQYRHMHIHTHTQQSAHTNERGTIGYLPTDTSSSWARSQGLSGSEETLPYLASFNFSATETRLNPSCFHSLGLTVLLYNLLYHYDTAY